MANTYFRGPDDPSYGDMYNKFLIFHTVICSWKIILGSQPKLTYTLLLIFNYTNSTLFYFLFTILPNTCTSYLQCSHQGCNLCSLCRSWTLFRIFKSNARTFMCLTNAMGWAVPRPLVPLTECKCFILLTNISLSKNK